MECGPGESCYVHEDGITSCFPSGLELDGWTECPPPGDGDDDDGDGEDDGDEDPGGDAGGEDEGEDEGEEDDEGEGDEDEDGEGDEDEDGAGDEDDEDGEGDDEENGDGEGDEEGAEDGWDTAEDDEQAEPGAGGCAGFAPWPSDMAGRLNMVAQMVNRAAGILGIPTPPVTLAPGGVGSELIAQYTDGRVELNPEHLAGDARSFNDWMESALHEVFHAFQRARSIEYWDEMAAHRRELYQRGIRYRQGLGAIEWGDKLDDLRDQTRPTGDPALADAWDFEFDETWRNQRLDDLSPAPGKVTDDPVPQAEYDIYVQMAAERQARQFASRAMDDYGLRCDKPGEVKEAAGRSQ